MKKLHRFITIYRIAVRYRLHEVLDQRHGRIANLLLRLPVTSRSASKGVSRGKRLRLALQDLGPVFIKFGQLLSTRRDLVPEDIADELAFLQDQVPPFSGSEATSLIEKSLGDSVDKLFVDFASEPLASASVAQVHTARLKSGEEVAIKVIRPGIEKVIMQDIALMHSLARLIENRVKGGKRLRAVEVVQDYELVILDELNLLNEAANTSQLARNFEHNDALYVPRIYWDYCRTNVLVMERIYGIPVNHKDELLAAGIDMKKLAETGVEIFFTQVFNHSYFHADMHPGNIFVSRQHTDKPQYIALDCAIIGTLSKADQQYLARNLLAIFKRDYRKVAELHVQSGWVPADTPIHAFEATMRSVCEPIFEKPLGEISFGMLLLQLFRTASRFNMEVQPSLVLLQKTLLHVEGLGKQLYPELDLWQTALPFLEEWQRQRLSPLNNLKKIQEKFPEWLEQLPEMPELIHEAITQVNNNRQLQRQYLQEQEEKQQAQQQLAKKHRSILAGIFLLTALASVHPQVALALQSLSVPGLCLGVGALFLLFWPFSR